MKKVMSFCLVFIMLFGLSACGNTFAGENISQQSNAPSSEQTSAEESSNDGQTMNTGSSETNILVAYLSATGTTETVAKYAADILGADLYEILPEDPYTSADLAYYTGGRADQEQDDPAARPAITGSVQNMERYDTVLIAYPIWHGQAPKIISTFLESYDFTGKTIVPFCTSHSSGIGSSVANLHALCPAAQWMDGSRFSGDTTRADMETWLNGLGIVSDGSASPVGAFNFETHTVLLNSGYEMPINGLGTYSLHDDACVDSVATALSKGVRLIDTAHAYGNEEEVGEAIRNSGIPREEIFVITKLYPDQFSDPEAAIEEALEKLDIGYIDMMLLHHPGTGDVEACVLAARNSDLSVQILVR